MLIVLLQNTITDNIGLKIPKYYFFKSLVIDLKLTSKRFFTYKGAHIVLI